MGNSKQNAPFWSIGKKLGAAFTALLALLLCMAALALQQLSHIATVVDDIVQVEWKKTEAATAISETVDANTIATMQQLFAGPEQRQQLRQTIDGNRQKYLDAAKYLHQAVSTAQGQSLLQALEQGRQQYVASQDQFEALIDSGDLDVASAELMQRTLPILADIQTTLKQLTNAAASNAQAQGAQARHSAQNATYWVGMLSLLAVVVGAIAAWRMALAITRPIQSAVHVANAVASGDLTQRIPSSTQRDETAQLLRALGTMNQGLQHIAGDVRTASTSIASATTQIATGNMELSSRTEEQASALEETTAAMQEIVAAVQNNHLTTQQALTLAQQAAGQAQQGGQVVEQAVDTMHRVSQSSQKIAEIVGLIEGIAFQTNILALNAAVEAARAGEQGRGFAVVATEVRALASRSANAAKEIRALIQHSVGEIDEGCHLVAKAGDSMGHIVNGIQKVATLIDDVTRTSHEQLAGLEQIKNAVVQMDTVTQHNAALVEEGAAAAQALQAQAQLLVQTVAVLKTEVLPPNAQAHPALLLA